jgi:hypothetical protein
MIERIKGFRKSDLPRSDIVSLSRKLSKAEIKEILTAELNGEKK